MPCDKVFKVKAGEERGERLRERAGGVGRGNVLCLIEHEHTAGKRVDLDPADPGGGRQPSLDLTGQGRVLSHLSDLEADPTGDGVDDANAANVTFCRHLFSAGRLPVRAALVLASAVYSARASAAKSLNCSCPSASNSRIVGVQPRLIHE